MKKALFMLAVMMTMSAGIFAQGNSGDIHLINKAKQAAQAAGCLDNWNGQIDAQVTVISACFASGFVTEVLLVPVCHGPGCENVRLGALARVMFYCTDEEVGSVECLSGN